MSIEGTDVSSYQSPTPDYTTDAFGIVKCTQGIGYVNPEYRSQVDELRNENKLVGHYCYLDPTDPRGQVDFFFRNVDLRDGEIVMLDIEGDLLAAPDPVALSVQAVQRFQESGETPLCYMSESVEAELPWGPLAALGTSLAIAAYNNEGPGTPVHWPFVTMWQHSDTNGSGGDSDTFYGDATAWHKIADPGTEPATPEPAPVPAPAPAPAPTVDDAPYHVQPDDTYSGIAARFGYSLAELEAANPGVNYDLIHPGDPVHFPPHNGATEQPPAQVAQCVVQEGDTLSGIAQQFGVSLDEILSKNPGITNPDHIEPGQVINL